MAVRHLCVVWLATVTVSVARAKLSPDVAPPLQHGVLSVSGPSPVPRSSGIWSGHPAPREPYVRVRSDSSQDHQVDGDVGGGGKPHQSAGFRSDDEPSGIDDSSLLSLSGNAARPEAGPSHRYVDLTPLTRKDYTLPAGTHTVKSPNFPSNYTTDQQVDWGLTAASATDVLTITCPSFDLELPDEASACSYDFLSVNGERFCGASGPRVTASALTLQFLSDYSVTGGGFSCRVAVAPAPAPPSTAACCGVPGGVRIVGGAELTPAHRFPWQVALVEAGSQHVFCGGSVLNTRYVLTAAHCTDGSAAGDVEVCVGMHSANAGGTGRVRVAAIVQHAGYDANTVNMDVSLLRLAGALVFGDRVRPVCMPRAGGDFADAPATVSGWGKLQPDGEQPDKLHHVTVHTMSNGRCRASYGTATITDFMLCAFAAGKDACQGDSGGPLTTEVAGRFTQIGVVSWGAGCADPLYPGVYARLTALLWWVDANSSDGGGC